VHGFLLPGHVSVVTGAETFRFLPRDFGLPAVVAGFTPADVLRAVLSLVDQTAAGEARLENAYQRVVTDGGNQAAQRLLSEVFVLTEARWRGLGALPGSGLALRDALAGRDASRLELPEPLPAPREPAGCRCGEVLTGRCDPPECALYGQRCVPDDPVGACMVSSEGACAAWYRAGLGREAAGEATGGGA
jgi:hydrogenase expression/formation protein HypD